MVASQNVTANHRVNDAVFTEDGVQTLTGRFMYGPLDMVTLTGEKVMTDMLLGTTTKKRWFVFKPCFVFVFFVFLAD